MAIAEVDRPNAIWGVGLAAEGAAGQAGGGAWAGTSLTAAAAESLTGVIPDEGGDPRDVIPLNKFLGANSPFHHLSVATAVNQGGQIVGHGGDGLIDFQGAFLAVPK